MRCIRCRQEIPKAPGEVEMIPRRHVVTMVAPERALPGHTSPMVVSPRHAVLATPMHGLFPGMELAMFGMGCFWGAEELFWLVDGVYTTASGYSGGYTPNPTYQEVCSGQTGHAEVVQIVFDPRVTSYQAMLEIFWENHDPTQGMRQGADVGTQYRSAIYWHSDPQRCAAEAMRDAYQISLREAGFGVITTKIAPAGAFYYAEDYHQQYLAKNPFGYCRHGSTGVPLPTHELARPA
jgi:peptide-methionine (S)-S-oxide reductase